MPIIDKIDKLSGTDTRSRNITQAIDKYSGKGPSKNIDDAVKKLDETGTLGKMGIKERIDHLSNAQTMSRNITQAIDRHTNKGPSKNIEEALKWWEDPTPPGPGITEAYAVYDGVEGTLTFFRDEPGKYIEGQVIGSKTYYTGIENGEHGWNGRNITTVQFDDVIKPVSTNGWFYMESREEINWFINLERLDTSNVTDMSNMFRNCYGLSTLDLSSFDTSNVTDMQGMFYNCNALRTLDLSSFNTSNVTNMSGMFSECRALTTFDMSDFDTSNVTNMSDMFSGCDVLTTLDLSGFDTSNATDMSRMFIYCRALTTDITISDISKYSADMFNNAATIPPAKITLYGEGSVTSDDIDTFIASVKAISPDSNIVNGMISSNVVFDGDVVWDFEGYNRPEFPILSPLIPIEDRSIDSAKYIVQYTNPQMRQGSSSNWGDWADAIVREPYPGDYYIESNDGRNISYSAYIHIFTYDNKWHIELEDQSGEGHAPTKFHVYVEKRV